MDKIGIMPGTGARQVGSSGAKAERGDTEGLRCTEQGVRKSRHSEFR